MNPPNPPGKPPHSESDYRPDSASIIHAVVTRPDRTGAMKGREAQQREQIERTNVGLLLHALHDIADSNIPPAQRRLVQESEVQRAITMLRRFFLLYPEVRLEQLLTHCEEATTRDRHPTAHLIDPFQLRHVLTFQADAPHTLLAAEPLAALERLVEHSPTAEIAAWFARIEDAFTELPKSAPVGLRTVFARACRAFTPAANLEALAFETAVLTVRIQGVVGFEDTRLFFSLLKQIGGSTVAGLEGYLQSDELNHAVAQHRATDNNATADHLRGLANKFNHRALPALEQHLFATIEARHAPPPPPEPPAPAPEAPPAPEPRRGLFSGLRNIISRE